MSKFGTYTKFTARPRQKTELVEQLLSAAALMENAAGCELYIVNTVEGSIDSVWVTEIWDRQESHDASLSIDGVRELIGQTMPLLDGEPEQIRLVPVGGKGMVA